ncbi:MAG TPA: hypothetical protein DEG17_16790 [Cyanobacteria bacterium UBA11149]|nr:hypothetical protein [Cyanobacteria bacterium UBA11367]HBE58111.1 hypothetical protein [Cyanobacteria bacterium UBA11366]HBK62592.1 hypothetical protein [Cyanobacteria bacterium UBA11166]HBR76129.1 hypothetical protein [Cyanobacteria bacterium UBA11159]HBS71105.1 hypothetical protein [Cyanobacteria bacterium UBA11153]HBW90479.1 hypothetical protein [Cyanobacteria bacterium UBA11149]HCA97079.1 hypothetical protein [Cyanobacteria bacterium UBA9226]
MQYKILLSLASILPLATSMLTIALFANRASATEGMGVNIIANSSPTATSQVSCDVPTTPKLKSFRIHNLNQGTLIASSDIGGDDEFIDFTAAESDAAVTLFGCDCSSCMNALRQLRSQTFFNNSEGHCWTSMEERVSSQQIQEVLRALDAEDASLGKIKLD